MFDEITFEIKARMKYLEDIDRKDRIDGTPRMQRLRQIPPETGKFLALTAVNAPDGIFVEIGTSAGYSTMWLALAAREKKTKIITFEILPEKARLARETIEEAKISDCVELIEGDFLEKGKDLNNIAFCFLDAEKEIYEKVFDVAAPKIVKNGILVADNATNHYNTIKPMMDKAVTDGRFDCLTVPIGKGEFVCRRK